ncbi:MAG: Ig-like domain-containing protein [Thermoplasmata archaeon]
MKTDPSRSRVYLAVTPGLSIYYENNGTVLNLNETHGLPSPRVNSIDGTPSMDLVFLATSAYGGLRPGGLSIFNASTLSFANFGEQEGLSHAEVDDVSYGLARDRLYLSVRPGGPTNLAFPIHSVLDIMDLGSFNVTSVTTTDGIPGGIIWDLEYDGQEDLILMAADESFGELTGYVGGGIVIVDPSSPTMLDLTQSVGERAQPISVSAGVTDPDGIASVEVEYIDIGGKSASVALNQGTGNLFSRALPGQEAEGILRYRLAATDSLGHTIVRPSFDEWLEIAIQDTTPPTIIGFVPIGDAVPVETEIVLDFSEQMDLFTMPGALSILPVAAIGPPVEEVTAIRFSLVGLQYQTTYTIVLDSTAQDLYGNRLDGDGDGLPGGNFQWSFTTVEQPTPPRLMAIAPPTAELGEPIRVQADVQDEDGVARVNLTYEDVRGQSHEIGMTFLGQTGTQELWLAQIPAQSEPGTVTFRVSAWDTKGAAVLYPLQGSISVQILKSAPSGIPDWVIWISIIGVVIAAAGLAFYGLVGRRSA